MKIFSYSESGIELVKEELLLIKEFARLFELKWNKGIGDAKGERRQKCFKAFAYIYLTSDWKSPYCEMSEKEKEDAAKEDVESLPGPELDYSDELLIQAKEKYKSIQETRTLKLLHSAYKTVDELRIYFETLDLKERDEQYGRPVHTAKDVIANISNLGKLIDGLTQLEESVKKDLEKESGLRSDAQPGLFD